MKCASIENKYHISFYHHIGLWGGIWKAPNTFTINSDNANQMDVQLIEKFSKWEYKSNGIQERLPYLMKQRLTTSTGKWGSITGKSCW